MKISIDDPRLTAFALGELEGEEADQMKNLIDQDPEAKKYVEEIQNTARVLSTELDKESKPRLEVAEREAIFQKTDSPRSWWKRWKVAVPAVSLLAAGVIGLVIMGPDIKREIESKVAERMAPISSGISAYEPDEQAPPETASRALPQSTSSGDLAAEMSGNMADEIEQEAPYQHSESLAQDMGAAAAAPSASISVGGGGGGRFAPEAKAKKSVSGRQSFGGLRGAPTSDEGSNTEAYKYINENAFKNVADEPLSTFSADVDTASYANVRRFLVGGQLPPKDAVRIEEMVNYFTYDYPQPHDGRPFSVTTELANSPWTPKHKLLRIGLKGKETPIAQRPASNLVFLLDVSGSMMDENKLPLVQKAMKLLVDQMREKDRVAIVVYAGSTGVLLDSTSGTNKRQILEAIDKLSAGGSTNGASGIQEAYRVAQQNFIKGGNNRVILATDGDFNVGVTSEGDLVRMIEEKAKTGVFLSVLGFGSGNLKDSTMQMLANKGNGNHAYIDSIREARKVLVQQAGGTLNAIAKDVKLQIEFNLRYVSAYRLIGYEKRILAKEDFNDDRKDAGEIGEGHTVTALYEVIPAGVEVPSKVDALKYQKPQAPADVKGDANGELATVKLRYKAPEGSTSELITAPIKDETKPFASASSDFKFASSVAAFGMNLRESPNRGDLSLEQILETANQNVNFKGKPDEYRKEFVELIKQTRSLKNNR